MYEMSTLTEDGIANVKTKVCLNRMALAAYAACIDDDDVHCCAKVYNIFA